MEDAHLCKAVRRHGTLRLLPQAMLTSPRRFHNGGILKTLAFDTLIWGLDLFGWRPHALARAYRRDNEHRGG